MPVRVLFVDDDATFRRVMERELAASGFAVHAAASAEEAVALQRTALPDVALVDLRMPGVDGMELHRRLVQADPQLPVVILTGHGAVPEAVTAMRAGAYDFLTKPCRLEVLESCLRRASERRVLQRDNRSLRRLSEPDCGDWIGDGPRSRELLGTVDKVAASPAHVLIHGESGTGKELVAARIHRLSERAERPLVIVHCGAIPSTLMESELFGHQRGAFTGADRRRIGLLEAADGGTVFFDEIGELPLEVQPTLLRALQSGEIRPVGATETRRVDFRVVAATHRDLLEEVRAGRFREDLYYRLATIVVEMPPLRERLVDFEPLARGLLGRHSAGRLEFGADAIAALRAQSWPGNVRELENAVVRLATLAQGPVIGADDVARFCAPRRPAASAAAALPSVDLHELERLAIEQAMAAENGDKPAAAAALGVSLKTLYNKLARHGLRDRWRRGGS